MLFNSYEFIFAFLPITFFYVFFPKQKTFKRAVKGIFSRFITIFLWLVEYCISTYNFDFNDI